MNSSHSLSALCTGLAMSLALIAGSAHAAEPTAQQNKMATCNKEAGDMKGDERKAFMKKCLSAKPAATTQQEKMKLCNAEAKGKTGDERKKFMSECLSAKAPG
jgi:hypothetical protein